MKNKYFKPALTVEELEKKDVLCKSWNDNDDIDYNGDRNSLLRTIGEFAFGE